MEELKKVRKNRLYIPVIKIDGKWKHAQTENGVLYPPMNKKRAVLFYQNWLLAPYLTGAGGPRELHPITPKQQEEYDHQHELPLYPDE